MHIKTRKSWCYDLETYPNFFSATFVHIKSDETHQFVISPNKDQSYDLIKFVNEEVDYLIGYNSLAFDDLVLNYILKSKGTVSAHDIYEFVPKIINARGKFWQNWELKSLSKLRVPYRSLDLMKILAFDKLMIGLKAVSIHLKWKKIQDLPYSFNKNLTDDQADEVLAYNLNDVHITKSLYEYMLEEIKLRADITRDFGIDVMNASNSGIADRLMSDLYSKATNQSYWDFKDSKTVYGRIHLSDVVSDKVKFNHPQLKEFLDVLKRTHINTGEEKKFGHDFNFEGCKYTFKLGGLHSNNPPGTYLETDEIVYIDMDVASYYPRMMINLKVKPKHLDPIFTSEYEGIVNERINAKKAKEKVKEKALKITINSIFGKLGFDYGWLKDNRAMYQITVNGQLFLLMLAEKMHEYGFSVVYANTDGLVVKARRSEAARVEEVAKEWEEELGFVLEYNRFKAMYIRDVNNYLMIDAQGDRKVKGCFITDDTFLPVVDRLKSAYTNPIVADAICNYLDGDIPIEETVKNCKDIFKFCASQKVGSQFKMELHSMSNGQLNVDVLQKTNRWYVSNTGGGLCKRSEDGSVERLVAGRYVTLFNDYFDSEDYNIDYDYYIKEAYKIVNVFTNKGQLTLL